MKKTNKHGGSRKGSGRKPGEETKVRRIPVSILDKVDKMVAAVRKKLKERVKPVDLVLLIPAIVGLLLSIL